MRFANAVLEPFWNRTHVESVQITMAEDFGIQGRGAFYDQTGAISFAIAMNTMALGSETETQEVDAHVMPVGGWHNPVVTPNA